MQHAGLGFTAALAAVFIVACVSDPPTPVYSTDGGTSGTEGGTSQACAFTGDRYNAQLPCGASICGKACCFNRNDGSTGCDDCAALAPPSVTMACDSTLQCDGTPCCLAVRKPVTAAGCSAETSAVDVLESRCVPSGCDEAATDPSQYTMCRSDADCSGKPCRRLAVKTGNGKELSFGICY